MLYFTCGAWCRGWCASDAVWESVCVKFHLGFPLWWESWSPYLGVEMWIPHGLSHPHRDNAELYQREGDKETALTNWVLGTDVNEVFAHVRTVKREELVRAPPILHSCLIYNCSVLEPNCPPLCYGKGTFCHGIPWVASKQGIKIKSQQVTSCSTINWYHTSYHIIWRIYYNTAIENY